MSEREGVDDGPRGRPRDARRSLPDRHSDALFAAIKYLVQGFDRECFDEARAREIVQDVLVSESTGQDETRWLNIAAITVYELWTNPPYTSSGRHLIHESVARPISKDDILRNRPSDVEPLQLNIALFSALALLGTEGYQIDRCEVVPEKVEDLRSTLREIRDVHYNRNGAVTLLKPKVLPFFDDASSAQEEDSSPSFLGDSETFSAALWRHPLPTLIFGILFLVAAVAAVSCLLTLTFRGPLPSTRATSWAAEGEPDQALTAGYWRDRSAPENLNIQSTGNESWLNERSFLQMANPDFSASSFSRTEVSADPDGTKLIGQFIVHNSGSENITGVQAHIFSTESSTQRSRQYQVRLDASDGEALYAVMVVRCRKICASDYVPQVRVATSSGGQYLADAAAFVSGSGEQGSLIGSRTADGVISPGPDGQVIVTFDLALTSR